MSMVQKNFRINPEQQEQINKMVDYINKEVMIPQGFPEMKEAEFLRYMITKAYESLMKKGLFDIEN